MSATGKTPDDATAGFTLLEMLVVLAVAALIAGIGFPRLQAQLAAQEWRTGVSALTALLREARAQAVRTGRVAVVAVSPDGNSVRRDDAAPLAMPASVTIAAPQPTLFYADGSSSGGAFAVTGGARRIRISIAPPTGLLTTRLQ